MRMTFNQFKKIVESYNKGANAFTNEEMVELCCIHKCCVYRAEKDWSAVAALLGAGLSKEAARSKARKFLSLHPEYEVELQQRFATLPSAGLEDYITLYKQQVKTRDATAEYRKLIREDARIEALKETIQQAARSVRCYTAQPATGVFTLSENPVEAVLLLSDWHIGVLVDNFYNKYNLTIATAELLKLVQDVKLYCLQFGVRQLNILNMGDLIHGGIHTNARVEQEFDVITQVEFAGQLLYKVISDLESAAPVVTYRSCSDNHARFMANKSEHIEKENFGRLIDWWLEAKLEQGGHHIVIKRDNLDWGLGKFTLLNGKKIMFAHGHEDNINQAYQNFTGATKEFIDYILLAHYHNPKEKAFQDCKVIVNGSLVGTEQYALSKRLFTSPTQKLLIFDQNLVDISIDVNTRRQLNEH